MSRLAINVFTTYYYSPERDKEFRRALLQNLTNPFITNVYLFEENHIDLEHSKLNKIPIKGVPSFEIFTRYFQDKALNIICNGDVSFSKSIRHLKKKKLRTIAYCITRREYLVGLPLILFKMNVGNSQDAWGFWGRLEETITEEFRKIDIGKPGNDNALAYILEKTGYTLLNPSFLVVLKHHHRNQARSYSEKDRIPMPYKYVKPDKSLGTTAMSYITELINRLYNKCFR